MLQPSHPSGWSAWAHWVFRSELTQLIVAAITDCAKKTLSPVELIVLILCEVAKAAGTEVDPKKEFMRNQLRASWQRPLGSPTASSYQRADGAI
jgi:hypothetical protein